MPLNVTGTALQLQSTEACTLFYTFVCFFCSTILLLFFFFKQACKLDNRLPTKQETQCLRRREMAVFSPFQIPENGVFGHFPEYTPIATEEHYCVHIVIQGHFTIQICNMQKNVTDREQQSVSSWIGQDTNPPQVSVNVQK